MEIRISDKPWPSSSHLLCVCVHVCISLRDRSIHMGRCQGGSSVVVHTSM